MAGGGEGDRGSDTVTNLCPAFWQNDPYVRVAYFGVIHSATLHYVL